MAHLAQSRKKKHEDSMMCVKDMEDLALELRNVQKQGEELKKKIEVKQAEVDLWTELLNVSTGTEIEEIISSSQISNLVPATSEKQEMLIKYIELDGILTAFRKTGMVADLTADGDILVQFLPTKHDVFPAKLLLQLSQDKEKNSFSVVNHNLVDFVPVDELAEEYLIGPKGNIKTFITHVAMHTSKMIKRHNMFHAVKDIIDKFHYNADCTKLCLVLPLQQNENEVIFELILLYHPLDLVPYKVTVTHFEGVKPNEEVTVLVEELQEKLHDIQVDVVLMEAFSDNPDDSEQPESTRVSIEGSEFSNILGDH